jgi:Protein of unknown function (DUF3572)
MMVNYASKQTTNKQTISADLAESMALNFVRFLAADDDRIQRFQGLTGMDLDYIRECLTKSDTAFLGNVLDYALADEALLLAFAASENLDPAMIVNARKRLPGHSEF